MITGKLTLLSVVALTGFAVTSHAALIASYGFNEAAGSTTIADSTGTTGNATQATLNASTLGQSSVTAGTYGALTVSAADALNFGTAAGFSSGSDRFDVNTPGATAIAGLLTANGALAPTGTFTIMAWVNATATNNTFFFGTGNGSNNGWKLGLNSNKENFVTVNVLGGSSSGAVSSNAWHHVAFTYNNGVGSYFIDGVASGTTSFTGYNEDSPLASIGSRPTGSEFFTGKIDDLKIFNTVLTLSEVQVAAVPEPSTYGVIGAGALAAAAFVRRRKRVA